MMPLAIRNYTATTALGRGRQAQLAALEQGRSGLQRNDFGPSGTDGQVLPTWIGRVEGLEQAALPNALSEYECRNNRLAWLALTQDDVLHDARSLGARYGSDRVAVVIGTSTSSIGATEEAYTRLERDDSDTLRFPADMRRPIVHTPHSIGRFVQAATGLRGPCMTVATACSSSAKVFAQAARLIASGQADAALVGGVDTLCGSVLYGFHSLGLVSAAPCRPFDARRDGLSLGEAGGFALLERADAAVQAPTHRSFDLLLQGYGESSDAHHMSAPHPDGLGACLAIRDALARAGITPAEIGYLNLHGTATPSNDVIEARTVASVFPDTLHASSTKGWTGHTLGAAGIVESVITLLALEHALLPGTLGSDTPEPANGPQIRFSNARAQIQHAMNTSFGFGGNNCALIFGRA